MNRVNHLLGPKMIFIQGGTYIKSVLDNIPVTVGDLWVDETPVTVAQYREAVKAGACTPPDGIDKDKWSNWEAKDREDHPVNYITWRQACAYAKWAEKRLPIEEEWEWAARSGPEGRLYPWGGECTYAPKDSPCWEDEGRGLRVFKRYKTYPVGSFPKWDTKHGIKDFACNVYEWTSSTHEKVSGLKVIRGGDVWNNIPDYRNRFVNDLPDYNASNLGFRCVKDV